MSQILNEYQICSKISEEIKEEIKIFYVFDDTNGYNVLFITSDDNVFGFGSNGFGCCGLGHRDVVNEPQIIPELCGKGIKEFFHGMSFYLALSNDNLLYGWGQNHLGQLCRGCLTFYGTFLKPSPISFKYGNIIQLSVGSAHTLVLTSEGSVYGWGCNEMGQIGCGKGKGERIFEPTLIIFKDDIQIKNIFCSAVSSFVLTTDGFVYSWGWNGYCHLGHDLNKEERLFEPKLIYISNVISVCPSSSNTYFLTNEGILYFCGLFKDENKSDSYEKLPRNFDTDKTFSSLHSTCFYQKRSQVAVAVSEGAIDFLDLLTIQEVKHISVEKFFCDYFQITCGTVRIEQDQNELADSDSFELDEDLPRSLGRFKNKFRIYKKFTSGASGIVYGVRDVQDTNLKYAVKKIPVRDVSEDTKKEMLKEVETMSKCSGDYVVQYFDSWFENNNCLYIQLELCFDNLKNVIKEKSVFFERKDTQPMNGIEYFVCCEIFKELLECVRHLHESNPHIIHRDLKPENILFCETPQNNRFVKICDFGLSKTCQSLSTISGTRGPGTPNYIAPEVNNGTRYSIKADIYSLGVIATELFEINVSSIEKEQGQESLISKRLHMKDIIISMMNVNYNKRPSCSDILSSENWKITKNEMKNYGLDEPNILINDSDKFLQKYLQAKILLLKQSSETKFFSKILNLFW